MLKELQLLIWLLQLIKNCLDHFRSFYLCLTFEIERPKLPDVADQHLEDSFRHVKFATENQV